MEQASQTLWEAEKNGREIENDQNEIVETFFKLSYQATKGTARGDQF
jgi:hypothetical protein